METTETAIRMVGQLLLHHMTTGSMFRDSSGKALFEEPKEGENEEIDLPENICSFCYVGAIKATASILHLDQEALWDSCNAFLNKDIGVNGWDAMRARSRSRIARKLANYKETP